MDATTQRGRHVVLYGERGVGKTSFANIMRLMLKPYGHPIKIICDTQDTVESLWKKVFDRMIIKHTEKINPIGFEKESTSYSKPYTISDLLGTQKNQSSVLHKALQIMPSRSILIFDEFDRLGKRFNISQFVDHIKDISDNYTEMTFIVVGLAQTINELITEHQSLERNLMQIQLLLMTDDELSGICKTGIRRAEIQMEESIIRKIVKYSCGFPHFTHLLCLHSCKTALMEESTTVNNRHFELAIQQSVEESNESLNEAYQKATHATKDNIYTEVLYACSEVPLDEYGTFQASDIIPILSKILNKKKAIQSFLYHLGKFCEKEKGEILVSIGVKNNTRYKFRIPSMRAFIKLKAISIKSNHP